MERRVVVLGENMTGKTFLINHLLGLTAHGDFVKRTASCVRREGEVAGRKLILIDTPGWWKNYRLIDTSQSIKQEIVLSVTKCPPGPHAFILVISPDAPFTEKIRKSVEEHLGLFGENIWEHTIVMFTREECLEGKTIDQHIDREGNALKWLLEKCNNRFLTLQIHCSEGESSAIQLLDQIDSVMSTCRKSHFDPGEETLRCIEEKRSIQKQQAMLRQQKVTKQRHDLQKYDVMPSLQEIRIYMLGWLISGKTAASRTILGQHREVNRGRTSNSVRNSGLVSGKQVSIVDTPGWWKYLPTNLNPPWVGTELRKGLKLDSKAPHAILLAVPADTSFLEEQRKITEDNMKMFGEQVWRHTMVLFTCGDLLANTSIEEHIESEGEPLKWLVEKCGNRYHVLSWDDKEEKVKELLEKIEEMVADISLFKQEPKEIGTVNKETSAESEAWQRSTACILEQKWQRMDKAMEEYIAEWAETSANCNQSMEAAVDFTDTDPFSEDTSEEMLSKQGDEVQQQTNVENVDKMTGMTSEMLEKEWVRWEIGVTERFHRMLSEVKQSQKRVMRWLQQQGTSGISSGEPEPPEEND